MTGPKRVPNLIRENAASLCVVGNSSYEIDKGRGEEIDGHRLVICFDNYSADPEFRHDYGSKTDIWVRNPRFRHVWRRDFDRFRLVTSTTPIYWRLLNALDIILELDRTNQAGDALPSRLQHDSRRKLASPPSSGLPTIAWLHQILDGLRGVTVIDFSMTDPATEWWCYYTEERCRKRPPQDWSAGRKTLDQLAAA